MNQTLKTPPPLVFQTWALRNLSNIFLPVDPTLRKGYLAFTPLLRNRYIPLFETSSAKTLSLPSLLVLAGTPSSPSPPHSSAACILRSALYQRSSLVSCETSKSKCLDIPKSVTTADPDPSTRIFFRRWYIAFRRWTIHGVDYGRVGIYQGIGPTAGNWPPWYRYQCRASLSLCPFCWHSVFESLRRSGTESLWSSSRVFRWIELAIWSDCLQAGSQVLSLLKVCSQCVLPAITTSST